MGQKGPIFNLGGTFGGAATRSCTVPHNKPVFFPIITTSGDNCGVPPEFQLSNEEIIAFLENTDESVTSLELDVDGTVIGDNKTELAPFLIDVTKFSYFVPEDDSLYDFAGSDFAGVCKPSWNSGYYVMLSLEPGPHTLHFSGSFDNGFALETTYHLDVK